MKEVRDVANQAAQNYLERNWAANMAIESHKQQIKMIHDRINTVKTLRAYLTPSYKPVHDWTDLVAKLMDLEEDLLQAIDQSVAVHKECRAAIESVENPTYRALLEYRYLSFLNWDDIADRMHYDKRYLFKLHDRALNVVAVDNAVIDEDRVLSIGLPSPFHIKASRN